MIPHYGYRPASSTIYIPWHSFAAATGASSSTTGFAAADVKIYKNGSTTERSSANGITATTDFDSRAGINLIVIDLSDNTDSGFYAAGNFYAVCIDTVTIDSQTVRFWAGTFDIGVQPVNLTQVSGSAVDATAAQLGVNVVNWKGSAAPAMTGDAYARLGAPAGASVSADVAAIKSDSGAIKTQTDKLTFTVANQIDANVLDWKSATAPAMTGDAYARLGAPAGASVSADIAAVKADTGTSGSIYTRIGAPAGASVSADIAAVKTDTGTSGSIYTRIGAPAGASVSADIATVAGYIDTEVAAIKAKTDNLPASPAAVSDIPTANACADALLDRTAGIETSMTLRQGLRIMLSAMAGKASGLATTTAVFRDTSDSKNRITATVDANGNRTAVTLDAT